MKPIDEETILFFDLIKLNPDNERRSNIAEVVLTDIRIVYVVVICYDTFLRITVLYITIELWCTN